MEAAPYLRLRALPGNLPHGLFERFVAFYPGRPTKNEDPRLEAGCTADDPDG